MSAWFRERRRRFREQWCAALNHPRWTKKDGAVWCYTCARTIRPSDPA